MTAESTRASTVAHARFNVQFRSEGRIIVGHAFGLHAMGGTEDEVCHRLAEQMQAVGWTPRPRRGDGPVRKPKETT